MHSFSQALRSPLFIFGLLLTIEFGLGILAGLSIIHLDSVFLVVLPVFSLWMIGASVAGIPGILITVLVPFIFGIWCMRRALRRINESKLSINNVR